MVSSVGEKGSGRMTKPSLFVPPPRKRWPRMYGYAVDQGKVKWDIRWWTFSFAQLYIPYVNRELKIKDLFTHNSGVGNATFSGETWHPFGWRGLTKWTGKPSIPFLRLYLSEYFYSWQGRWSKCERFFPGINLSGRIFFDKLAWAVRSFLNEVKDSINPPHLRLRLHHGDWTHQRRRLSARLAAWVLRRWHQQMVFACSTVQIQRRKMVSAKDLWTGTFQATRSSQNPHWFCIRQPGYPQTQLDHLTPPPMGWYLTDHMGSRQ